MEQYLQIALLGIVFLFAMLVFLFLALLWSGSGLRQRKMVRKRLLYISAGGHGIEKLDLYRKQALTEAGALDRFILSLPRITCLDRLLLRSGLPLDVPGFVVLSLIIAILATAVGFFLIPAGGALCLGAGGALLPWILIKVKEQKFLNRFGEQLPEGIDLLARALRAGHALTSGFGMITEEMDEPIKSEFAAVMDEVKMGLSLKEALDNLCARIPNTDLKFFTVAVLLQRETGGNLTEILDKISLLIRERMKFKRQVRSLTAEGRLSGQILLLLPVAMFVYIYFANYSYISLLWTEPEGFYLMGGGIGLMLLGALSIKKITMIDA
jgi:tight adherence protein B